MKFLMFEEREFGIKFIEWVNLVKLLGAHKIHIYRKVVHPDVMPILEHFEKKGFIEVTEFSEPSDKNFEMHSGLAIMLENNVLTDCVHRVRNLYNFVVFFDTDEVIVPVQENVTTWQDLMKNANHESDFFSSQSINYPHFGDEAQMDGVADYHYILRHTLRSQYFYGVPYWNLKSFVLPQNIIAVHAHHPFMCLRGNCQGENLPTSISQTNHYRDKVKESVQNITVSDQIIWKFKDKLTAAVETTLKETRFKP